MWYVLKADRQASGLPCVDDTYIFKANAWRTNRWMGKECNDSNIIYL